MPLVGTHCPTSFIGQIGCVATTGRCRGSCPPSCGVVELGLNPKVQSARTDLAFNGIAWSSRMDAIIGNKNDPELDQQPERHQQIKADLKRAASLLNSVEAAALADSIK